MSFQSAISRYLVSNVAIAKRPPEVIFSFNPLYRGTWFPTNLGQSGLNLTKVFQSAISRYLVSNQRLEQAYNLAKPGFNPLYRGTWFPTIRRKLHSN